MDRTLRPPSLLPVTLPRPAPGVLGAPSLRSFRMGGVSSKARPFSSTPPRDPNPIPTSCLSFKKGICGCFRPAADTRRPRSSQPHRDEWKTTKSLGRLLPGLILALVLLTTIQAHPQGCSQCRETIGQTPARTQSAYRKAIVVLVIAGTGLFTASVLVMRRFR